MAIRHPTQRFEALDGRNIAARVNMSITFFMKDWRGREAEIVKAYQRVRPLLTEQIRWYRTAAMRSMRKVAKDTLDAPLAIEKRPPSGQYALTFSSGPADDDVGPVTFYLSLSDAELERKASAFHLALPLDWAQDSEGFRALFLELAELLPFRSGLGGYATQVDEGEFSPAGNAACRRWLRQYEGIDCMDVIISKEFMLNKAKGVNWLTALDKSFAQKLGRLAKIRSQLPADAGAHALGDNLILQAGKQPRLLDTYKDEDRSTYEAVDSLIKPILVRKGLKLPPFADREETVEWLTRFERPSARSRD